MDNPFLGGTTGFAGQRTPCAEKNHNWQQGLVLTSNPPKFTFDCSRCGAHEVRGRPATTAHTETPTERVRRLEAEYREAIVRARADQDRADDSVQERRRAHARLLAARAELVT